jgi:hypothetical protein
MRNPSLRSILASIAFALCGIACSPFGAGSLPDGGTSSETDAASDLLALAKFSFFYTSVDAMKRLSGSPDGFGGDLRFGMPTGLEGADKICQTIADGEGFGAKTWRAFLSATQGPNGVQVNAIDRIGEGPWYDRMGRTIALDKNGLLSDRPMGDSAAIGDLPDEKGNGTMQLGTSYDAITGSNRFGMLYYASEPRNTCMDWTSSTLVNVLVVCGHTWLSGGISNWIEAHPERSCLPGVSLASSGVADGSSIGAAGGWGGFYCFALTP